MARHFKQPQPTPEVEDTRITGGLRGRRPNRRKQNTTSLPYGQAATYHYTYPSALPSEDYYTEERPARGGLRMLGRGLLLLLAWTFRVIAFGLVLLIIANFFLFPIGLSYVTFVTDTLTGFFPWAPFGVLGIDTPFAGTFRGDLAILALFAFIIDWLLCRARARLV